MAMNENESKTTVSAGTPKNSGRYPWVEDDGLKALSEMDTTLIDLDDQLRGVLEDIQYYFGHYGSGEDKGIIGDLDHAIELLIPRLGYQKALIRSQYNKKATQLNELAMAYAGLIEEKDQLHSELKKKNSEMQEQLMIKGKLYSQLLDQNKYLKAEAADNAFQANQLREENERLTAKVKEAEETNIKLVTKNYELETRVHRLESESGDSYDYDKGYSEGYYKGFDDGIESMYDALLTMMGIINVDDFEEVFHISETATDKEIIEYFRQMHPRVFMEECERYKVHGIDTIKAGDEVEYVSGWRMIVTEVKDKWYKGIIRLSQSPTNIRKGQCRKTGNHYSSIPFSYDGRMAIDDKDDEDEEF